jgi:hypothetical protein
MAQYDEPRYTIVLQEGPYELRSYAPFYTACVAENHLHGTSGFRTLFSYISGENERQEKMAMTIPVINDGLDSTMTMEFVLPLDYTEDSIPKPVHSNMTIKAYPEHYAVVVRFSGSAMKQDLNDLASKLKAWSIQQGFNIISERRLARYNSPFSVPFLRHNELIYTVKP